MEIQNQKKAIRKEVKLRKEGITEAERVKRSEAIWEQLEKEPVFLNSKTMMMYWSMPDEVYTPHFIQKWYGKKRIILPVVKGDHLELREYTGNEGLVSGESYGIPEPEGISFSEEEKGKIDLIIVPGVAFDKNKNRLGRGKGYYDKLLKTTHAYTIGVCFLFQLFDHIPCDAYDVSMDSVISEI